MILWGSIFQNVILSGESLTDVIRQVEVTVEQSGALIQYKRWPHRETAMQEQVQRVCHVTMK